MPDDNRLRHMIDAELEDVALERAMIRRAISKAGARKGWGRLALTAGFVCAALAVLVLTFRNGAPVIAPGATMHTGPVQTDAVRTGAVPSSATPSTAPDQTRTRFYRDGKVGFRDAAGRVVIEAVYACATDFNEYGVAIVAKSLEPSAKYALLGRDGVLTGFDFDAIGVFAYGLASVRVGEKYGYINASGSFAVPPQYTHAEQFRMGLAAVAVKKQGDRFNSWGFIDVHGNTVVKPMYHGVTDFAEDGTAIVRQMTDPSENEPSGSMISGVIDSKGTLLLPVSYYNISPAWQGIRVATSGIIDTESGLNRQGLIDETGNWIVEPRYFEMGQIENGLVPAGVIVNGQQKTGLLRIDGSWQIKPTHQSISERRHGMVVLCDILSGDVIPTMLLCDERGKPLLGGRTYTKIDIVGPDLIWCVDTDSNANPVSYALLHTDGTPALPGTEFFDAYEASDGCAAAAVTRRADDAYGIRARGGGLFNGYGLLGLDGRWLVQPQYNRILCFDGTFGRGVRVLDCAPDKKSVSFIIESFDGNGNVLERSEEQHMTLDEYARWAYAEQNYNAGESAINRMDT